MRIAKSTLIIAVQILSLIAVIGVSFGLWALSQFPSPGKIRSCFTTSLYKVYLCPGSSSYVPLSQISDYLKKSIIISEDAGFYGHSGFDLSELQKSFELNLQKGKFARGGSTITQQLAKNLFLSKDKTLLRKGFEAIIAIQLERNLSKNEILERYLNVVQFGKKIFGVKAASTYYFKKHPSALDPLEAAFLAFLLPNPEIYSKSFYKKSLTPFAQKRLKEILAKLVSVDRITRTEYEMALEGLPYFLTGQQPPDEILEDLELIDEESAPLLDE
jgi:monofunctional biosynthetic peptidoglycan transglycosylase